jgi:DNA repair protein RadC
MTSPSDTLDYFRLFYAGKQEREHFALTLLDSQNKLLDCSIIFSGTIDGASIYPREIVKAALYGNAAAVILAHYVARNIMCLMCPTSLCTFYF